jgi:hypothetical protein
MRWNDAPKRATPHWRKKPHCPRSGDHPKLYRVEPSSRGRSLQWLRCGFCGYEWPTRHPLALVLLSRVPSFVVSRRPSDAEDYRWPERGAVA